LNQTTYETLCERWSSVKVKQIRKDIAAEIGVDASNLDTYLGISGGPALEGLFPNVSVRKSQASKIFDLNLARYESVSLQAVAAGVGSPTKKPKGVAHLRQASVVLAMGTIDAYVRQLIIDRSVELFFDGSNTAPRLQKEFIAAINVAVKDKPELMIKIANSPAKVAQTILAEEVFDIGQVRMMTGSFEQASKRLACVGLDIESHLPIATDRDQFFGIAPIIFDSFAQSRHAIVHTGTHFKNRTDLFCSNQEPEQFLGRFLSALVTMIENQLP
jgi:hypothetical protein